MLEHFILYNSCLPVKGAKRSTIYDMQRGVVRFIPNSMFDMLNEFESPTVEEIVVSKGEQHRDTIIEYFDFLLENEFGFFTDTPELFPETDMLWESPNQIINGIIDFNKYSEHNLSKILTEYSNLGCKHLLLRFFDVSNISKLDEHLVCISKSRIQSMEILFKYHSALKNEDVIFLCKNNSRISNFIVHSAPEDVSICKSGENSAFDFMLTTEEVNSSDHCGHVGTHQFSISQDSILESLSYNSCLNRKISIDVHGEIKNCPSMQKSYGNVKETSLNSVALLPLFQKLWKVTKEQIDTCKTCEFRYICTDCRAFHDSDMSTAKPKKCNYNPESMIWEE
ncbi:MAG: grasp-with-spasm system SPASM domain peptide maturase [Crocinitomix sp.]|nr:grasp-with-spasm system SPASM domain peptide maturase [Crocinitomix sp.]